MNDHLPNSKPYVTVIMPVRNEAAYIRRSLGSILSQSYPKELLQVIIVDGMSTDGTGDIIRQYVVDQPEILCIDNQERIVPVGLNIAIPHARGSIIVRVDGHCEIFQDHIERCVYHLENENVDGVGGSIETIGETQLARSIAIAMSTPFGVGDSAFRTCQDQTKLVDTVPFPAYTRKIIDLAGPYDEELVRDQDDEYNYRIRKMGGKILLAQDICSKYYSRNDVFSLWRQYYHYGFWKVRVMQKHPRQMRLRQFIPPAFVITLILAGLLSLANMMAFYILLLILGVYILCDVVVSAFLARQTDWRFFITLPLVFPVLHFSYGLGFLAGLLRFANRWGDKVGRTPVVFPSST